MHPVRQLLRRLGLDLVRYPSREHSPLADFLRTREIATVLDIGANIGQYATELRTVHGFRGAIVSMEPDPASAAILRKRAEGDGRWTVVEAALGETQGTAELHVAGLSVFNSLRMPSTYGLSADARMRETHSVSVAVTTVDEVVASHALSGPLFIKIDTQGYERPILMGATATVSRAIGLQLELSLVPIYDEQPRLPEMLDYVTSLGFRPWAFIGGYTDPATGALVECDGIFVREH